MPLIYCPECGLATEHVTISSAARDAQVTRTTVYNWLGRARLHTVLRPSGRTLVCTRSLVIYPQPRLGAAAGDPARSSRPLTF